MRIYTSYFAKTERLRSLGIEPIAVARWLPKHYNGSSMSHVAPTPYLLKANLTREQYIDGYRKQLERLDAFQLVSNLEVFGGGKDVALLCYEKPDEFCHRHLLAEWITRKTGIEVVEYDFGDRRVCNDEGQKKPVDGIQGVLF